MHRLRRALVLLAILVAPVTLHGQDMPTPPAAADTTSALRLFLDCASVGCDFDFLRTELTWVSYVRDRTDAQVHVISTSLGSGGGGSEVTLKFVGQKEFAGLDDEIKFNNKQGATSDETRKEFTRVLKIGLARYVLRTPRGASLAINYNVPSANIPQAPVRDPWNHWVFSLGGNAFLNGESQSKTRYLSGNLSAGRVTEDWKFRVSFSGNSNRSTYDLGNGELFEANSHSYYASGLLVKSLGPHLSAGATFSGNSSTQQNIDLATRIAPTIEYDFMPYSEYTRRRLILAYSLGLVRNDYTERTIFGKDRETRAFHNLSLSYATRTTWGSANVGVSGSNYLSDFSKNSLGIFGGMNVRLLKGLSFNINGSYNRVRDQITLSAAGASQEEILLRLRQLQTNYRYYTSVGLSYTFGSVFNNVVNPRLGNSGGGGEIFFN